MRMIGLGLIGCGLRLRGAMAVLLRMTDRLRVVALNDPHPEAVRRSLEEFNPSATVYDDYRDLVVDPAVDWVMIGSYNRYHAEQTIAAFQAGKDVFCEKPLATTLEDCVAMRDAWRASGRRFVIGFTLRYAPHYRKIKSLLDAGAIGKIISMEFNETLDWNHGGFIHADWRRFTHYAGTHLLEKCCHDIDLANWMTGSLAARVASFGGTNYFIPEHAGYFDSLGYDAEGRHAFQTWQLMDPGINPFTAEKDIVDNQVVILEYLNGVRATFHTNCATGLPERRMYLCGTEGTLRADLVAGRIEVRRIGFGEEVMDYSRDVAGGHGGGDAVMAREFPQVALDGMEPPSTLEDGITSAVTCFAINAALRDGTVVDVRPWWERAGIGG